MSVLSQPRFYDALSALAHVEAVQWPDGPVCPHCGAVDRIYDLKGKSTKTGVRKCGHCLKLFTVTVGTVMESSHVPLNKWLQAIHLLCSSKKGFSAHQLHRTLEVTYKTAWFMSHRIREAMRDGLLAPLGGNGKIVEADEAYIGRKAGWKPQRGGAHKMKVLSLVERGGKVRSVRMDAITVSDVTPIVRENVARESRLMTDESKVYVPVGRELAGHEAVNHSAEEWVRDEAHTNTLEGYFSVFKRGMKGVYQHCREKHLHRYLAEFDFRYNHRVKLGVDDADRAGRALMGIAGRRLTYRDSSAGTGKLA
jgi:transposase-like protein